MGYFPTEIDKAKEVAAKLEGVGHYMNDSVQADTDSGALFLNAAKLIRKLADAMCGQGYVDCGAGQKCTGDHK